VVVELGRTLVDVDRQRAVAPLCGALISSLFALPLRGARLALAALAGCGSARRPTKERR
jgi:hypothetical protein